MELISNPSNLPNPLTEVNVWRKMKMLEDQANSMFLRPQAFQIPLKPGRDVEVLSLKHHPPKKGLSEKEGQARLLHDLASIELQAFELGVRTLLEFPEAPLEFREQLLTITLEEAKHLRLCLEGLELFGFEFGRWPTHLTLWDAVDSSDDLLDRILIVHRYLEGSGLDASDLILRRLTGVNEKVVSRAVKVIAEEEVAHVEFGSRWYQELARRNQLDPEEDFKSRMQSLLSRLPRRTIPVSRKLRQKTGFTDSEIDVLVGVQAYFQEGRSLRLLQGDATFLPEVDQGESGRCGPV